MLRIPISSLPEEESDSEQDLLKVFKKRKKQEDVQGEFVFDNNQLTYPERRRFFRGELLCYPMKDLDVAKYVLDALERTTDLKIRTDIVVLGGNDQAYLTLLTRKAEDYPELFSLVNAYLFEHELSKI